MNCEKCNLEIKPNEGIRCNRCEIFFHVDCVKNNRNPDNEMYCLICGNSIHYKGDYGV